MLGAENAPTERSSRDGLLPPAISRHADAAPAALAGTRLPLPPFVRSRGADPVRPRDDGAGAGSTFPLEPESYQATDAPYEPEQATDPAAALRALDVDALPPLPAESAGAADGDAAGWYSAANPGPPSLDGDLDPLPPLEEDFGRAPGYTEPAESRAADRTDGETDTFPIDAFIVPESSSSVGQLLLSSDAVAAMADRLGQMAGEMKDNGAAALQNRLHHGDRLDAIIAAIVVGYLAAQDGQA